MMTHDPMCPKGQFYCCEDHNPGEIPPANRKCECPLIARVRGDERKRAALRVAAVPSYDDVRFPSGVVPLVEAVIAVAARNGES